MPKVRSILVFLSNGGVHPFPVGSAPIRTKLKNIVEPLFTYPKISNQLQSKKLEDYKIFDWDVNPLNSHIPIAKIPTPGIVLVIAHRGDDLAHVRAQELKNRALYNEKEEIKNLINTQLNFGKKQDSSLYRIWQEYTVPIIIAAVAAVIGGIILTLLLNKG